jgi:2-isopropylmalate synthase
MARRIEILDTTLRDGNKLPFVVLSAEDRLILAHRLERMGVDIIEAGFPVSSPEEAECVSRIAREITSSFVSALARALPEDVEKTLRALAQAAKPYLHIFMPVSPESLTDVVKMSESRAVEAVKTCIRMGRNAGVRVQFSLSEAPHARRAFRDQLCLAAREAGADVINLADSSGVLSPGDMKAFIGEALGLFGEGRAALLGVHCHNDLGLAAANTLAAIEAGASHVEVTLGGFGERAGNAALEEVAFLISAFGERFGVSHGIRLSEIAGASALFDEITGVHTHPNKPIIGRCALSAGSPVSRPLEPRLRELLQEKTIGRIEGAAAPATQPEGRKADAYRLESFSVLTGSHSPPVGIVVIEHEGSRLVQSSHGTGPIDALFKAVDRALGLSPRLVYYSLYTLATGPEASAEVTVTTELKGRRFHGRHGSTDVIEASLKAYMKACNAICQSGILDGRSDYVQGEYLWE